MLQIKVDENKIIKGEEKDGLIYLNDTFFDFNIISTGNLSFHIIKDHVSFFAQVIEEDLKNKKLKIKINNNIYVIEAKDKYDLLVEKLGLNQSTLQVSDLKAPMPGLILKIFVKAGDQVNKGDSLIILEAMKMENLIKSPYSATVKEVLIKEGSGVEKNQVLIKF